MRTGLKLGAGFVVLFLLVALALDRGVLVGRAWYADTKENMCRYMTLEGTKITIQEEPCRILFNQF